MNFLLSAHSISRVGYGVGKLSVCGAADGRPGAEERAGAREELTGVPPRTRIAPRESTLSVQTSTTKEVLGSKPPAQKRRIRLRPDRRWRFLGGAALLVGFLALFALGLLQVLGLLGSFRFAPAVAWAWPTLGLSVIVGTAAVVVLKEVLRQRALVATGLLAVARVKGESEMEGRGARACVVDYEFTDRNGRRFDGRARVSRSAYSGERVLALFVAADDPRNHILAVAAMYELVV